MGSLIRWHSPAVRLLRRAAVLAALTLLFYGMGSASIVGMLSHAAELSRRPMMSADRLIAAQRVLVIAHRGDSANAPENTLPAFVSGVQSGADLVELDYYHSADGVPVVFHDKDLDRTTDAKEVFGRAKISIQSLRLAELQRLDAGRWYGPAFRGTRIPTLEAALDTIQSGSTALVERKSGDPGTCIALLRRKDWLDKVVVQSFDWPFVKECHRLAPQLMLAALGSEELTAEKLDEIAATGARVIGWQEKDVGLEVIREVHRRGHKLWVYTVDDVSRARELVAAGIDGIITNNPRAIASEIRSSR